MENRHTFAVGYVRCLDKGMETETGAAPDIVLSASVEGEAKVSAETASPAAEPGSMGSN